MTPKSRKLLRIVALSGSTLAAASGCNPPQSSSLGGAVAPFNAFAQTLSVAADAIETELAEAAIPEKTCEVGNSKAPAYDANAPTTTDDSQS